MQISELIKLLQEEMEAFGDRPVIYLGCQHSEECVRVEIGRLGWFGGLAESEHATYLTCAECDYDAQIDKAHMKNDPEY